VKTGGKLDVVVNSGLNSRVFGPKNYTGWSE